MKYLIGYDISNPKRLQRVYRRITKFATPLQYSLFLLNGTEKELNQCLNSILEVIHKKEDDLRIYPITQGTPHWQYGKPTLPEGVVWTALY